LGAVADFALPYWIDEMAIFLIDLTVYSFYLYATKDRNEVAHFVRKGAKMMTGSINLVKM
jgi:hypothetical protein